MVTYKGAPTGPSVGFQQKPNRPGGSRMTFLKYSKIKLVTEEYSIQQSYYSVIIQQSQYSLTDMAGKYLPKQAKAERVDEHQTFLTRDAKRRSSTRIKMAKIHKTFSKGIKRQNQKITNSSFYPVTNLLFLYHKVVITSGELERNSAIHIHISVLPQNLLSSKLAYNIEQSSVCYTIGLWLSTLNTSF